MSDVVEIGIVPSELSLLLAADSAPPDAADAIAALEMAPDLGVREIENCLPERPAALWEIALAIRVEGRQELAHARAWLEPAPQDLLLEGVNWRGVSARDLDASKSSRWSLGTELWFGGHPLRDFHAQTRLLAALATEGTLVLDSNALTPRSFHWLREVALAKTPPSPSSLFTIHDVGDGDDSPHWLHTHGLDRSGVIELDALDIPGHGSALVGQLLNSLGALFLETGCPPPDEPFFGGEDIELVWLPWQDAVKKLPHGVPGGERDRKDLSHTRDRGVLFRPVADAGGRKYESLASYFPLLEKDPLFFVSSLESERMALLASERLPRFLDLLTQYGASQGWTFLVKLGFIADSSESREDREHLWFRVHAHAHGDVDATLLNQPYCVAQLSEGARGRHSLDLLSDWGVACPHGRFGPDNVAELERLLGERASLH